MNFFQYQQLKKEIVPILREGGIGVLPTDTLYGVVGAALNKASVEKIYRLRKRNLKKPMIVLISSLQDLEIFGIVLNKKQEDILKKFWPGKVTAILECKSADFAYLHRGEQTLALRLPREKWLQKFLQLTGPLVAPSANLEGQPAAKTKEEAKKYFGNAVDFYVDLGKLESEPSTIIKIEKDGNIAVLRQGAV